MLGRTARVRQFNYLTVREFKRWCTVVFTLSYVNYEHGIRYLRHGSHLNHISVDIAIKSADNTAHLARTNNVGSQLDHE